MEELQQLTSGECKFLDKTCQFEKVAFASFYRTGNSFLRKIIEDVTGVFTGSDMPVLRTLNFQQQGMLGEQVTDNSVWITKTHYPNDQQAQRFSA